MRRAAAGASLAMRIGFEVTPLYAPPCGVQTYTANLLEHLRAQSGEQGMKSCPWPIPRLDAAEDDCLTKAQVTADTNRDTNARETGRKMRTGRTIGHHPFLTQSHPADQGGQGGQVRFRLQNRRNAENSTRSGNYKVLQIKRGPHRGGPWVGNSPESPELP